MTISVLPPFDRHGRWERYGSTILLNEPVRRAEALSTGVLTGCSKPVGHHECTPNLSTAKAWTCRVRQRRYTPLGRASSTAAWCSMPAPAGRFWRLASA
jgi:hypothetical protein